MSNRHGVIGRRQSTGKRRLKDLLAKPENCKCADCGAPDPKWASANIGVFICLKCSGVHRSLGTHISKVLSATLDEWSDGEIDALVEVGGNESANSIYEAYIPEGVSKPEPDAAHEQRCNFIRAKYEQQEFLKPSLRILSSSSKKHSFQGSLSKKLTDTFPSSNAMDKTALDQLGMIEFIGMLKITILKGTNLAIRDVLTSDPYVVLTLGHQKVQTSVIKNNLNPVWNEDLMLSVPQDYGPMKLEVFDQDTFSADDIMGEAQIDIQPLITSATVFGNAEMFGDMQIGKWLRSFDNALKEDSIVNIVDGKIKQHVSLQLKNVESGEIDLEIQWIPLDQ